MSTIDGELAAAFVAALGLLITMLLAVQGERRSRFDRVLDLLGHLSSPELIAARHHLSGFSTGRVTATSDADLALARRDFYAVGWAMTRIGATHDSVHSSLWPLRQPTVLLVCSVREWVLSWEQDFDRTAEALALAAGDLDDEREAVRSAAAAVRRRRWTRTR